MCLALFGEEGEERSAILKYLEMCSPQGRGDSAIKQMGKTTNVPHIPHAQLLTVANFQEGRPWHDLYDYTKL